MRPDRDRITIAILALGGQGGGVLADWILDLASHNGYVAQGTSVPGVAQRTGSTVYYIELVKKGASGDNRPDPVLALMPVPGDVDIVIASELMEAGRAILRGFVSAEHTTLIGSTHRIHAISEKTVPGDGIASSQRILDAAVRRARRFIGFDMDAVSASSGSVISSVMFGALAGAAVLPFGQEAFRDAIRRNGKAVASNLKGFAAGVAGAEGQITEVGGDKAAAIPTSAAGKALAARSGSVLPEPAWPMANEGLKRLMDYQGRAYAELYLDRLAAIAAVDDGSDDHRLTVSAARHLALWMAYEDTIRIADLKIRGTRAKRIAGEVQLADGQILEVTEYMHPRVQEICDTLPAGLGRRILESDGLRRMLERAFSQGRHVETTSLRWFLALRLLASLRPIRPRTLRYVHEQARIEDWLELVRTTARRDNALAVELVETQSLLKGYGDTFDRGLANFNRIIAIVRATPDAPGMSQQVRALRESLLAGDCPTGFVAAA